ncbi:MAG TPA: anti-sigma factor [Candidatus Eisenbacteria bacterium]
MIPHRDEHLDLCAGFVLDVLDASDRAALEAHLAEGCPTCQAEIERLSAGVWLMAAGAPRHRAPAAMKSRVMAAVQATQAEARTPLRSRPAAEERAPIPRPKRRVNPLAWALAAGLLVASAILVWRAVDDLSARLTATRSQVALLREQLEEERRWISLLEAPQARVVQLAPTPDGSPTLVARLIYDPATRRAVAVCEHFSPPTGKDYQLWAISAAGPTSLGLLRADASGRAIVRLRDAGDPKTLAAFAVSLEREGGSPSSHAPAGPVVMVGKLGG